MDGPAFVACIRDVLIPEIEPGPAVILDTLATHRNKEAETPLRAHGCWFHCSGETPHRGLSLSRQSSALQPRLEPHGNGILKTQSPPEAYWSAISHWVVRSPQRNLRPLYARRMLELLLPSRICFYVNWKRFKA